MTERELKHRNFWIFLEDYMLPALLIGDIVLWALVIFLLLSLL